MFPPPEVSSSKVCICHLWREEEPSVCKVWWTSLFLQRNKLKTFQTSSVWWKGSPQKSPLDFSVDIKSALIKGYWIFATRPTWFWTFFFRLALGFNEIICKEKTNKQTCSRVVGSVCQFFSWTRYTGKIFILFLLRMERRWIGRR